MNQPFGACYSHFQEVADLAEELQRYKNRPTHNGGDNNMQPMDLGPDMDSDGDAISMEPEHDNLEGENDWSMDGGLFIEEYEGAAKEYGTGTTYMDEFDRDQYAGERIKNLYYPFASRNEWELAAFLLRSGLSMASIDSLLSLNLVSIACSLCVQLFMLSLSTGEGLKSIIWNCKKATRTC